VRELNETILPKGMEMEMFYDRSDLVGKTLTTVHKNLLSGFVLVVGVIWLFLRSLVGSLIVSAVIPLSLLVAFLGLHVLGLPANLISMGAIDFGILVDGAVVLVENVTHALRHQHPPDRRGVLRLVVRAAVDVGRPTLYAMLIIIAALVPVFTLESVEGRIFRPLALTYSFALVGALVFALTLVPALCAMLFRPRHARVEEPAWVERGRAAYRRSLTWALEHRVTVIAPDQAVFFQHDQAAPRGECIANVRHRVQGVEGCALGRQRAKRHEQPPVIARQRLDGHVQRAIQAGPASNLRGDLGVGL